MKSCIYLFLFQVHVVFEWHWVVSDLYVETLTGSPTWCLYARALWGRCLGNDVDPVHALRCDQGPRLLTSKASTPPPPPLPPPLSIPPSSSSSSNMEELPWRAEQRSRIKEQQQKKKVSTGACDRDFNLLCVWHTHVCSCTGREGGCVCYCYLRRARTKHSALMGSWSACVLIRV